MKKSVLILAVLLSIFTLPILGQTLDLRINPYQRSVVDAYLFPLPPIHYSGLGLGFSRRNKKRLEYQVSLDYKVGKTKMDGIIIADYSICFVDGEAHDILYAHLLQPGFRLLFQPGKIGKSQTSHHLGFGLYASINPAMHKVSIVPELDQKTSYSSGLSHFGSLFGINISYLIKHQLRNGHALSYELYYDQNMYALRADYSKFTHPKLGDHFGQVPLHGLGLRLSYSIPTRNNK